jgi:hypothetical protein
MHDCSINTKTKIIENQNLLSYMVALFNDRKTIGVNIKLLGECLSEWQSTEISLNYVNQISKGDVRSSSRIWDFPYPRTADRF